MSDLEKVKRHETVDDIYPGFEWRWCNKCHQYHRHVKGES